MLNNPTWRVVKFNVHLPEQAQFFVIENTDKSVEDWHGIQELLEELYENLDKEVSLPGQNRLATVWQMQTPYPDFYYSTNEESDVVGEGTDHE